MHGPIRHYYLKQGRVWIKYLMPVQTTIVPKSGWEKLLIYWHTKNHTRRIYEIALLIAAAIYTNHHIYEEEMEEAHRILVRLLKDESSVEEVMQYIELKLLRYLDNEQSWHDDLKMCRQLLKEEEELYAYCLNIFEADHKIDVEELELEQSLKKMLLRS